MIDGFDTLEKMERVATNSEDRPVRQIKILKVNILADPFLEFQDRLKRKIKYQEEEKLGKKIKPVLFC